jgi:hypothetical protein
MPYIWGTTVIIAASYIIVVKTTDLIVRLFSITKKTK